jgi:mRNA interferase RelE/StbE
MSYRLRIKTSAKKELKRLPKDILIRIKKVFEKLSENPRPNGVVKLKGTQADLYRVRIVDYRIVYEIQDNILVIIVVAVAHRREIYTKTK